MVLIKSIHCYYRKKILSLVHKHVSEGFWDTTRHILGRFNAYKTLSVHPYVPDVPIDENANYGTYSYKVYFANQLLLNEEDLNDAMIIIKRMMK